MRSIKYFQRCVVFIIICVLLVSTPHPVSAQQPQTTITATGDIGGDCSNGQCPLTITFSPAGGAVTGNSFWQGEMEGTVVTLTFTMTGTFAGGDGGAASGTWVSVLGDGDPDCYSCITWRGSWDGNFYANGTGSGIIDTETIHVPNVSDEVMESKIDNNSWQVTFSAEEFQAALAPAITSEYIFNTYGIRVEDSFGDDGWAQTAWTDRELVLLDEVLRELPPSLIKKMALTKIVRNKTNLDKNGNPKPSTFGLYTPCVKQIDPDCNGSSATIRIFDQAHSPFDFANDPNGDKEFKGSILHEMIHALQYHKGDSSTLEDPLKQKNGYSSPLMQNYMDATRPITDMNNPGFWANNGWLLNPQGVWTLTGAPGNQAPTDYAGTNPKEDLCESVMLYVYDPQGLQNSSPQRYNFICDQIFGGIEYENGAQKQP
jgi:hypothetical protein